MAGDRPASLGARSQASPSLGGDAGPVAVPGHSRALTPAPVLWQLDLLSCFLLLVLAPLGACLAVKGIVWREEVSPPSVGNHVPAAEH